MSYPRFSGDTGKLFNLQPMAQYAAVAVQNTWNPVMADNNVKLYYCAFMMATLAEDIECRAILNGITYTSSKAGAAANTWYYSWISLNFATLMDNSMTVQTIGLYTYIECVRAQIDIRKTSANGANILYCRVTYGK